VKTGPRVLIPFSDMTKAASVALLRERHPPLWAGSSSSLTGRCRVWRALGCWNRDK